jgi:hypothetical protein
MTGSSVHVTNLTPGSECNPSDWAAAAADKATTTTTSDPMSIGGKEEEGSEAGEVEGDEGGVAPSHLWDLFEQTLSGHGEACEGSADGPGQLLVIATTDLPADALPPRVLGFFQPDVGGTCVGAVSAVVDLTPPRASARNMILARGAAAIILGAVAPALAAAAARAARAAAAEAEAEAEAEAAAAAECMTRRQGCGDEETAETMAEELRRLRAEKEAAAVAAAAAAGAKVLANAAKEARARVARALQATAVGLCTSVKC